jgi:predicted deacetylase
MLLVSIHDVSPAYGSAVERLWTLCAERGVTPALLVVPNWHGGWPLDRHPEFVDWLLSCAEQGAEIAVHGERHDEVGLPRRLIDRFKAWGKTDNEGEFLTLDAAAAGERLRRGLTLFRRLGLRPTGFVPPAWLAQEATYGVAAAAGLAFSEDDSAVRLLRLAKRVPSPVVRWSARTMMRAWGSVGVAHARSVLQLRSRFPRIALHPNDLNHPATARSLATSLDLWLRRHAAGSYASLQAQLSP